MIHDNDLRVKRHGTPGRVVGGIRRHVAPRHVAQSDILHVKSNIVAGLGLVDLLVMHLQGLDLALDALCGGKRGVHAHLHDARFDPSDGDGTHAANFVNVLNGHSQGFVRVPPRWIDIFERLVQRGTGVPGHGARGPFREIVAPPSRQGDEGNFHGFVANGFEKGGHFGFEFQKAAFGVPNRAVVHFVNGHNHLFDAQRVGQQRMLSRLPRFGHARFKRPLTGVDHENGHVGLGTPRNHVFDKIAVPRRVHDSEQVLGRFEFPQRNVNGNAPFALRL
mmetsp:Transcript_11441/g.25482  ORF Transcript_11441/g.25482 Transcript_11441/m.25482 type:complete len:277 (+) Transcript_11441:566-1396(+)